MAETDDKQVTTITTTADLFSTQECINHLNKFPLYYRKDRIILRGSFGEKTFEHNGITWLIK